MSRLTRVSLAHRTVVLLLSLLVVALGLYTAGALKQELIPNIDIPRATIVSAYLGATPETVERDVTKPLEDAVKGVSGVTAVTSKSTSGVSQIRVEWEYDSNADKISTDVRNAVESTKTKLPADVNPTVVAGSFDDIPVVVLSVSSTSSQDVLSQQLKDIAIPALKTVPGVRDATLAGERARQVVVTLRQRDVDHYGVDVNTLPAMFSANGVAIPAGTVRTGRANLDVQVGTTFATVDEVKNLWVQGTDGPVRLKKIADVSKQPVELTSISRANGRPALTLLITKTESGNTVAVANGVAALIPKLTDQLGRGVTFATIFDQAPYIEQSVHDLSVEGGLGLAMAVVVIMLFLWSIRPTIITAISIPLSLCIALIGLWAGGFTLNILTLGALTVAIGRVVDDSIVVIENIKRHLSLGRYGADAIVTAVKEVAGAVTSSTLTTVAVFLPIGLVGGQAGVMFRPFAVTVTVALLASLVVALTVVPVLASWFMGRPSAARAARDRARLAADERRVAADRAKDQAIGDRKAAALTARLTRAKASPERIAARIETLHARYGLTQNTNLAAASDRHAEHAAPRTLLQRLYLPTLRWALGHRLLTLLLALGIFVGTMSLAPLLKTDFIGEAGQTSLQIVQDLPSGTSLQETDAAAKKIEALIAAESTVETFSTSVGSSSGTSLGLGGATDTNHASYSITLKPKSDGNAAAARLRAGIAALKQRGTTEVFVGRSSSDVIVYVETADQTKLAKANQQVLDMLHRIPDLSNIKSDLTDAKGMVNVSVDEEAAADAGMTQASIGGAALRAIRGQKVGTLREGETTLDIVLRSRKPVRTIDELRRSLLPVTTKQTMDARQAAADRVTAASDEFAAQQKADGYATYQQGLKTIRDSRAKAVKQLNTLLSTLSTLQKALKNMLDNPLPPGTVVPTDPTAALRQQIASVESGITAARAQIKALDTQYTKAVESYVKGQATQDRSKALQQQGKDAAKVTARALRLYQVADVHEVRAPATISRVGGQRTATVSAAPTGSDLGATTAAIQQGLARLKLPPGVTVRIGGVSQQQQDSFAQLGLAMLVAIAVVYLIMVATFGSLLQPLILLVSIPFAATGAIGLSLLTDTPLGLPSMIGLLMLIGIVVTNAIVLIDLINQYRRDGAGLDDSVMHGARLRLRPIVMTAMATIMALVPMALGVTGGGVFISKPLAIVVIGGLVSSTVLTLVLVPVLYDLVERLRGRGRAKPGTRVAAEASPPAGAPAPAEAFATPAGRSPQQAVDAPGAIPSAEAAVPPAPTPGDTRGTAQAPPA